jgi:hypothetical protein
MDPDLIDLYDRARSWATSKAAGATDKRDASTPCDEWDVTTSGEGDRGGPDDAGRSA